MKLEKNQIQKIDAYLKKHIKEWDIRLEIIDHLATQFESENITNITDDLLQKELGPYWKIKKIANSHKRILNKKYKNYYFNNLKKSINSLQGIIVIIATLILESYFKMQVSDKVFLKWNYILFLPPAIFILLYFLVSLIKGDNSYANAILFQYAGTPLIFFFNIIAYFKTLQKININVVSVLIISVFLLWIYVNTYLFFKKIKHHKKNYNAVKSLL